MGSSSDYSTCETILCKSLEVESSSQTFQFGLTSPSDSLWSVINDSLMKPPSCKAPLPPLDSEIPDLGEEGRVMFILNFGEV